MQETTSQVVKKYSFTIEIGSYFSTNSTDIDTLKVNEIILEDENRDRTLISTTGIQVISSNNSFINISP